MWRWLRRSDDDFTDEIRSNIEIETGRLIADGMPPHDARAAAHRAVGSVASAQERFYESSRLMWLDHLRSDTRLAIRTLRTNPAFTLVAVLSLALGIGANAALFSLVDSLLIRSLPVRDPDRLVQIQQTLKAFGGERASKEGNAFSRQTADYIRTRNGVFSEVVGFYALDRPAIDIDGAAEPPRQVERVSENYFRDLGVTPIVGRAPEASGDDAVVISHALWRSRFGGRSTIVSQMITIDGRSVPIVGVAPPRFRGLSIDNSADLWIASRALETQQVIGRLKPGLTVAQGQAAMQMFFQQAAGELPDMAPWKSEPRMQVEFLPAGRGLSQLRGQYERPLLALAALVILVLLITCTNVGSLLMVRHTARRREITVRVALGARRSRLLAQYLVESAILAFFGGALGLLFARWGVWIILTMLPLSSVPESLAFHADARVLIFTAAASALSALLFGLAPAWRAGEVDLIADLKSSQGGSQTTSHRRLGRFLVACQVGLAVLLVVGAGLFVQTLRNLSRLDIGFNADNLVQVMLDSRASGYGPGKIGPLYRLLVERVSAIPGVVAVSGARNPIMRGGMGRSRMIIPGIELGPDEAWDWLQVGPGFFETMGIPLRGRGFTAADVEQERPVVAVNEAFVRHYLSDRDPFAVRLGRSPGMEIIAVVPDVRLAGVRLASGPLLYDMIPGEPDRLGALLIRTDADADAIVPAVREAIRAVHPRLLLDVKTMRRQVDESIARERMVAATSGFFSLLGLLLASIGIFGVASYTVARRTNELGIRIALGAGQWSVIREAMRETMFVFAAGLLGGLAAAIVAVRLASSFVSDLLFGLTATDSANIIGAVMLMAGVALVACVLPARRATRIDPLAAIRSE